MPSTMLPKPPHSAGRSARAAGRPAAAPARRRRVDPTTCERDYTADEVEFMQAVERYKRCTGRAFPTCSELLEVVRSLGYRRPAITA